MNTDYIRSLLIMFNNRSVYEIETALAIYEFFNKDIKDVTDKEIEDVYNLVRSQSEYVNDYLKENIYKIENRDSNNVKNSSNIEEEIEK